MHGLVHGMSDAGMDKSLLMDGSKMYTDRKTEKEMKKDRYVQTDLFE